MRAKTAPQTSPPSSTVSATSLTTTPTAKDGKADVSPKAPLVFVDRNRFEDEFPVMFKFYKERGQLPEFHMQKVSEIQRRWKTGLVFWLSHDNQEIEIPEWVAVNVVINNRQNVQRGSRICMSLNHTKGYGCNRRIDGACSYVHECALCGSEDHGVFQKRQNGAWVCTKLRKWNEEEERFQTTGHGDPWKQEETLTALAKKTRYPAAKGGTPAAKEDSSTSTPPLSPSLDPLPTAAASPKAEPAPSAAALAPLSLPGVAASPQAAQAEVVAAAPISSILPPPAQLPPPPLPPAWQAIWSEEQGAYYFWHLSTNTTSWDVPPGEEGHAALEKSPPSRPAATPQQSPPPLEAAPGPEAASVNAEASLVRDASPPSSAALISVEAAPASEVGHAFVCNQHWRPQPGLESCLRLVHGDRVLVTWTSGQAGGWVYGHLVDDPARAGYLPREVLKEARADARAYTMGALLFVCRSFQGPPEVGGYLAVGPGDVLRLVAPMEPPYIWAYVERAGGIRADVGWVPETILKEASTAGAASKAAHFAIHGAASRSLVEAG